MSVPTFQPISPSRFYDDWESVSLYVVWLPASIPFLAIFALTAVVIGGPAYVIAWVWRHLPRSVEGPRS